MALSGLEKAFLVLTVVGGVGAIIFIVSDRPCTLTSAAGSLTVERDAAGLIKSYSSR